MLEMLTVLVERVLGWLWNRFRPLPIHVRAGHHDLYEISSITLAITPAAVNWANEPRAKFTELESTGGVAFVVPTALVVTVSNGHGGSARPVYLREVHLKVMDYLPEDAALNDKRGLVLRSIQAGGRGADARFHVAFDTTHGADYRLLRAARTDGYDGPLRMRIEPGRFAEVLIDVWPSAPGRYRLRVTLELTNGRRTWFARATPDISVIRLSHAATGPANSTESHEFQQRRELTAQEFRAANDEKLALFTPVALPVGRDLKVSASMETEAK